MTSAYKRKTMRLPIRVRLRRLVRAGFLLTILGLIPFFLSFMMQDSASNRFTGLVEAESETVGPVAAARILSIDVQAGQRVNAGDVLVRLDPADRALDLAMQETRLLDYQQSQQRYRQTLQESERRSHQGLQEAAVALETEKMNRACNEAELAGLKAEITRLQPLIDKRLVSEIELSALRPKAQALEQTVARYAPLLDALQKRYDQSVKDLEEVRTLLAATENAPQTDAVAEPLQRATQTFRQIAKNEPSVLRASRAGVVSRIQRQAGDVVMAGEPIVRVASSSSLYITGLLTQSQFAGLSTGDTLRVLRLAGDKTTLITAQVEMIDPEVMDLLDPFNPSPRFPTRGRRVRLRILEPNNNTLVPGETVTMQPIRQGSWLDSVWRICSFAGCRSTPLYAGQPLSGTPNGMKKQAQKKWMAACGMAVWLAAGCASMTRETPPPPVPADAPPAITNTVAAAGAVTNAPPADGYTWEALAYLAVANSSEAKALLLDALAEKYQTAVDTGWRNPQLRLGTRWGDEDDLAPSRPSAGNREWGDGSFDGQTAGLRLHTANPFVNRWLRQRGAATARALEAQSEETAYAVFCEVRALCLESEMARVEIDLLQQMAAFREQARNFRKEQSDAGVADALELIRAETRLAALRSEIREKQTARQQMLRRMAIFTGVPAEQLRLRPPDFERRVRAECLAAAALTDMAFMRRPDLMRAHHEQEAAEHKVKAAQAGNIPWFEYVEATCETESGTSTSYKQGDVGHDTSYKEQTEWQARVAITLPVFNWLGDEVKLSRTQLAAASARVKGLYATICAEVSGVLEDYQAARAERDRLADECKLLQETMTLQIDALAKEPTVRREDVLAAREELAAYQRICMKAERECLRMEQHLETVSGGSLTQER
ncbi:MAG: TolC family protein [bacterium]